MWIAIDILIIAMLWLGVVLTLPHLSGWNKLASVYRAQGPPSGERFPFEWAKVGEIYFWNITVYRSQDGIYLAGSRILRQPALLIPWSELRNPREKQLLFRHMEEFDVGSPSVGTLQLRSEIVKNRAQVV
jgi:hypothetical protein